MIQLETQDFRNLLSDLYIAFAPNDTKGIDFLVEKYGVSFESQVGAVQMALMKYFTPKNPNYNKFKNVLPGIATQKNVSYLMESYARGERIISEEAILSIKRENDTREQEKRQIALEELKIKEKAEEEDRNKKEEERLKAIRDAQEYKEKSSEIVSEELEKSREELRRFKKEAIDQISEYKKALEDKGPVKISALADMDIEIMSFDEPVSQNEDGTIVYKDADINEIEMPDKKYVVTFCIGQRFMTKSSNGGIVGVEVVNIIDDYISDPEKPKRMLNLRKS